MNPRPQIVADKNPIEFSILMPCLNEAETLATCIKKAQKALEDLNIAGEIVVADNGSTDGSPEIAASLGARVVHVAEKGYGSALLGGIQAAGGKYIIMGDADDSYDFTRLDPFVEKLRAGYEFVMGNRFKGGIEPSAMPVLHRYLGNPVLTGIGRLFFKSPCGDFHCGLRGFSKAAIQNLDLRTTGMEFASETVVKASLHGLRVTEVPTTLSLDGRTRSPHLRSWRDGWRHLRFLLLYSPRWLFLYPGLCLMLIGSIVAGLLLVGPRVVDGITFDVHTLLYAAMAIIIGYQTVTFAVFTKVFAITEGLLPEDPRLAMLFRHIKLETGIIAGGLLLVAGIALSVFALSFWSATSFGPLDPSRTLRLVIPAATLIVLGLQTVLSSFFLSILGLKRH
ncbi:MAG TPA: glycosyltransferase family 2 protein [Pyrinomonadaceae bacterium]|nr:glycosyltransferase family 2 protein [Pyrinomonadaceae bacterium]